MNKPGITQLQHWMKEVITCQGAMQYKLQRAAHLYDLNENEVVADTRDVSVYSRLHVYTSGYVMRLMECLDADFPVLRKFTGAEVFDQFARASLMWSPSTSYSLYDLGNTFIRFLEATRPPDSAADTEQNVFLDLPIEIAKAERARQETIRSKGLEASALPDVEISPEDIIFDIHRFLVSTPPCLRLLVSKFPVKQLIDHLYDDEQSEIPEPQKTYLAISRMNYRLTLEDVEEWQFYFLDACRRYNLLMDAINETSIKTTIPTATIIADLCFILPLFREKGFLVLECRT